MTMESTAPSGAPGIIADLQERLRRTADENVGLKAHIGQMRKTIASLINACEEEQEGASNKLLREISRLKEIHAATCDEVDAQEARLADRLEARLREMRGEKAFLENALEQEQERIVNKLQRQMEEMRLSMAHSHAAPAAAHHLPWMGGASEASPLQSPSKRPPGEASAQSPAKAAAGCRQRSIESLQQVREHITLAAEYSRAREGQLMARIALLQDDNHRLLLDNSIMRSRLCRRQSLDDILPFGDGPSGGGAHGRPLPMPATTEAGEPARDAAKEGLGFGRLRRHSGCLLPQLHSEGTEAASGAPSAPPLLRSAAMASSGTGGAADGSRGPSTGSHLSR